MTGETGDFQWLDSLRKPSIHFVSGHRSKNTVEAAMSCFRLRGALRDESG
jgi:hypothetical protein